MRQHITPDDFYVVERTTRDDIIVTDGEWGDAGKLIDCPFCPRCGGVMGMRRTREPYGVRLDNWGRGFADVVRMPGYQMLFSERLMAAMDRHGIKKLFEVNGEATVEKVRNRKRSFKGDPPRYWVIEVGTAGPALDLVQSGMMRSERVTCSYCLESGIIYYMPRLIIDCATVTDEDIFRPRGLVGTVVVSRRFAAVLREINAQGFELLPALQMSIDYRWSTEIGIPSVPPLE